MGIMNFLLPIIQFDEASYINILNFLMTRFTTISIKDREVSWGFQELVGILDNFSNILFNSKVRYKKGGDFSICISDWLNKVDFNMSFFNTYPAIT